MEFVFCSTCLTIVSTGPHNTVYAGRNRDIGGGSFNAVGEFGGGAVFVFGVFGRAGVSLLGFEVYGALKFV